MAAKCLNATCWNETKRLPEELTLYMRMSHPNICRLLEAYVEPGGDAWLCMDYCNGGELFEQVAGTSDVVRPFAVCDTEEHVAGLLRQMAAAFRYLHGMGVVHRDNKLENWVFATPAQERIMLIDFGFATLAPVSPAAPKLVHVCGTCYYVAPEVLSVQQGRLSEGSGYGAEVDVWAFGVILYMLISGTAPFAAESEPDILWEIADPQEGARLRSGPFTGRRWEHVTDDCKDLVLRCLTREPAQRFTVAQVQTHPWLSGCRWQDQTPRYGDRTSRPHTAQMLHMLLAAGAKLAESRILAFFCGHLAQRINISAPLWTWLQSEFNLLEGPYSTTPKGAVSVEDLVVSSLRNCDFDELRGAVPPSAWDADKRRMCHCLLSALDLTSDRRLHFYEFIGALIAAGRVDVRPEEVASAFQALDIDRDGIVSVEDFRAAGGKSRTDCPDEFDGLGLPIRSPAQILHWLAERASPCSPGGPPSPVLTRQMQRVKSDPSDSRPSARGSANLRQTQRFLSKLELTHPWEVERRLAFTAKETTGDGSCSGVRKGSSWFALGAWRSEPAHVRTPSRALSRRASR